MKYLYLIYENSNRELLSKILLTIKALKKNWVVYVGQKNELRYLIKNLKPGVIIEKGMRKGLIDFVPEWKKSGHLICASDEEALTYTSDQNYFDRNLDNKIDNYIDFFFSIGPRHTNTIKKKINKKKIIKAGSVKYDLYKKKYKNIFENDVRKIKEKYGNYILITSRFGNLNTHPGRIAKKIKDDDYKKESKIIFKDFLRIPELLSKKNNKINIIYRPHPSEDYTFYKKYRKKFFNTQIINEGNVAPWILASDLLIQNRCTTGIEGYLLSRKTISFEPYKKKSFPIKLFNSITNSYSNLNYLIKSNKNKIKIKQSNEIDKIIFNYKEGQKDASTLIIDTIEKIIRARKIKNYNVSKNFFLLLSIIKLSLKNVYDNIKNSSDNRLRYQLQKNGDKNLMNYHQYFDKFKKILNLKSKCKITKVVGSIYRIEII